MTTLEALFLGLIQGLTEFLPVSSSGHLVLAERILGISNTSLAFELITHLGTLLAVVIVYRKALVRLIRHPLSLEMRLLAVATIPSVIIVFAFQKLFRNAFDGRYLAYCFLITAIILIISSQIKPKPNKKIGYFDAVIIGVAQGFAAFPGISRSGSTICTSVFLGNERSKSAQFSFLLSIPIIIGSAIVELIGFKGFEAIGVLPLMAGFFSSFIFGMLAIKLLLKILNHSFNGFAVYLFILSVFLILNDYVLFLF